jgi:nucleotide-binding universal stress UspA family protein
MYEKILVAIDESQAAERVLAAAQELASLSGGAIWLLHVWEPDPSMYKTAGTRSCEDAYLWLKAAADQLAESGISADAVVIPNLYGYAAREITHFASSNDIDVIVMGSRGRNDLTGLLAGSTAHKVIHLADRPVVVVR